MHIDRSAKSIALGTQRGFFGRIGSGRNHGAYRQTKPLHCIVPVAEGESFQIICSRIAHRMVKVPGGLNGYCENHYDEAVAALKPLFERYIARTFAYRDDARLQRIWDEGHLGARGPNTGPYKRIQGGKSF